VYIITYRQKNRNSLKTAIATQPAVLGGIFFAVLPTPVLGGIFFAVSPTPAVGVFFIV